MEKENIVIISAFPNYRYNRTSNRLFRGFGADVEIKPDIYGLFTLKKNRIKHKMSQVGLMSITSAAGVPASSIRDKTPINPGAIIEDFKKGKAISLVQREHHISYPTAKKYKDIAEGKNGL